MNLAPRAETAVVPNWAARWDGRVTRGINADLVAGRASRLGRLGVVASTVELAVFVEVDEVHQELLAHLHQQHGV